MKLLPLALAALIACPVVSTAAAAETPEEAAAEADRWRASMQSARWTGPMLASNAETLPKGRAYTEPYFFDVISGGDHSPGSSGYYQYGLFDGFTVGFQPNFSFGTSHPNRHPAVGDVKLLTQLRLTRFTPENRVPTIAIVLQEVIPVGKHDRLDPSEDGHGSGSFATEVGVNLQHYFLLRNDRLLRARINLLKRFSHGAEITDRSVYGTGEGFRGRAKPSSTATIIGAIEYSLSREWVLALDVLGEARGKTRIKGRYGNGPEEKQVIPSGWYVGFAPAIEYNWSDKAGVLLGVRIIPKGHNTPSSITPAIAYSRFW